MALDLLIVGDSGLAKETAQLARQIDPSAARWQLISYVGEKKRDLGKAMAYGKVGYADDQLANMDHHVDVALGVGYPGARARLAQRFVMNPYLSFPNLLHPKVEIDDRYVTLGRGNMVCKGAVITCDILLGDFNLLNWNVTVGHDTSIGSFSSSTRAQTSQAMFISATDVFSVLAVRCWKDSPLERVLS